MRCNSKYSASFLLRLHFAFALAALEELRCERDATGQGDHYGSDIRSSFGLYSLQPKERFVGEGNSMRVQKERI